MRFVAGIVTGFAIATLAVLALMAGPQAARVMHHEITAKETYLKAVVEGLEKCREADTPGDTAACVERVRREHQANLAGMIRQRMAVELMLSEARGLTNWMDWARFRAFVLERQVHLWMMADGLKQAGLQAEVLSARILAERRA